jgi:hypothetical protein
MAFNFLLIFFFLLPSCVFLSPQTGDDSLAQEIVMSQGMEIVARNSLGTIKITAGKGLERSYTWEGGTRSVVMKARKEHWGGKLGIYFPGEGQHWTEHNGVTRAVLEEAERHFHSFEEIITFLNDSTRQQYTVYRDDGLVVTWHKEIGSPPGKGGTLLVNVWQLLLDGKKPTAIAGSQNENITVRYSAEIGGVPR